MADRTPHHVIVEVTLDDDPQDVAFEIVDRIAGAKNAQPAFDDGFGHLVATGTKEEAR